MKGSGLDEEYKWSKPAIDSLLQSVKGNWAALLHYGQYSMKSWLLSDLIGDIIGDKPSVKPPYVFSS